MHYIIFGKFQTQNKPLNANIKVFLCIVFYASQHENYGEPGRIIATTRLKMRNQ